MKSRSFAVLAVLALLAAACATTTEATTTTSADQPITTTTVAGTTTTISETTTTQASVGVVITISNFSFGTPRTVKVGEEVTVQNEDAIGHTWTSDDDVFDSGTITSGNPFTFTFDAAGEYTFFCKIHPTQMMGSITVEG